MGSLPKWKPRRTVIDLYNERDQTLWYWRICAVLSASMIMVGFLVFPSAFNNSNDVNVKSSTTRIIAIVILASGYSLSVALWFICHNWLFQLDALFIPCLSSCILGLFNILFDLNIRHGPDPKWSTISIAAVILASISILIYTLLSLLTFRKIYIVRSRDIMHRGRSDSESINLLPEDELQRQQLLRLLLQRDGRKASSDASTFRIDLPDSLRRSDTHLRAPHPAFEPRTTTRGRSRLSNSPLNRSFAFPQQNTEVRRVEEPPVSEPNIAQHNNYIPLNSHVSFTPAIPDIITPPDHYPSASLPSSSSYHSSQLSIPHPNDNGHRYPHEKQAQLNLNPLKEIHPVERDKYRMALLEEQNAYNDHGGHLESDYDEEIIRMRSASRESRRVEIERGGCRDEGRRLQDIEGVQVVPRIFRVETDGFGRV